MSAETKRALDDALAAHIADDLDGAIVTGYILMAAVFPADAPDTTTTIYKTIEADGQAFHVGLGLSAALQRWYRIPGDQA